MRRALLMAVAICVLGVSACQTSGAGSASSLSGDITANLAWQSDGGASGTMTADLNTGAHFQGPFFQITRETRVEDVSPLWNGWGPGPRRWDYWGPRDWPRFVTHYSGRVVANLAGEDGAHMRCRFHLANPSAGMSGGGQGECQLPDGRTIDAVFPAQ